MERTPHSRANANPEGSETSIAGSHDNQTITIKGQKMQMYQFPEVIRAMTAQGQQETEDILPGSYPVFQLISIYDDM